MKSTNIGFTAGFALACLLSAMALPASGQQPQRLHGVILDAADGNPVPARLYIESGDGEFFIARSEGGVAIPYEKTRGDKSTEIHTSLSAHPFEIDLLPGTYTLTAERGKEYLSASHNVTIGDSGAELKIALRRWINMSDLGWYSGDTHVHRSLADLPTLILCEDLNVALPLTYWVSKMEDTPLKNNRGVELVPPAKVIHADDTHVIWPINTEYEINSVNKKRHTLGALFVLNHQEALDLPACPTGPIAIEGRKQGALFDLDKHNWPWSLSLVPAIRVDLFELTNNHIWRTNFAFKDFHIDKVPDYMEIERDSEGYTERGWIDFGLKTWYSLLNCGLDLKPSAGTASGVHPVPLGFGRVYVKLEGPFRYESWISGLREGRSFVTTGPMLVAKFNGRNPGARFALSDADQGSIHVAGEALSTDLLDSIEIIVNGEVARRIPAANQQGANGQYSSSFETVISIDETSWVAVRTFANRPDGRQRFAHTAQVDVEIPGKPLRPRRIEVEHLVARAREEFARNENVLPPKAVAEFKKALEFYEALLEGAR